MRLYLQPDVTDTGTYNTNAWQRKFDKYYVYTAQVCDHGTLDCGRRSAEYFASAV